MHPLLKVSQLSVSLGSKQLLKNLSFTLFKGERLALIGQSGSGKSLALSALSRLLPRDKPWTVTGSVYWKGEDLLFLSPKSMQKFRRGSIAYIPQEAMSCLNPSMRIGKQLAETASDRPPAEWLEKVGLPSPRTLQNCYPHELSGGMKQRVVLAIALASKPQLLLADEVTSALDVHSQRHVLQLIDSLCAESEISLILVTHDISVAEAVCPRSAVMYQGALVEYALTEKLLAFPEHHHTQELVKNAFL